MNMLPAVVGYGVAGDAVEDFEVLLFGGYCKAVGADEHGCGDVAEGEAVNACEVPDAGVSVDRGFAGDGAVFVEG